jgi:predicted acyltransferase
MAFPGFVFAMGSSAVFSWSGRIRNPWSEFLWALLVRVGGLFLIGFLFNIVLEITPMLVRQEFDFGAWLWEMPGQVRIFGVLQRLALTYALGMVLAKMAKTESRVFVFAALLLLLSSAGYHIYAPAAPFALPDNISRAVDVIVPGAAHVSQHYGLPFDPEGLYGTMSSAASMLFGLLAGHVLKEHSGEWEKGMLLAFGGAALVGAGWFWSDYDIVGMPLWTSPYALLNAGADMLLFAALGWIFFLLPFVGVLFRPFCAFGRNPLVFFLATQLCLKILWSIESPAGDGPLYVWIWRHTVMGVGGMAFSTALFAVLWCALWWPLAEWMYRRGIVVKL